ncbi:hypothetical protein ABK040_012419 [Willaertia magna]
MNNFLNWLTNNQKVYINSKLFSITSFPQLLSADSSNKIVNKNVNHYYYYGTHLIAKKKIDKNELLFTLPQSTLLDDVLFTKYLKIFTNFKKEINYLKEEEYSNFMAFMLLFINKLNDDYILDSINNLQNENITEILFNLKNFKNYLNILPNSTNHLAYLMEDYNDILNGTSLQYLSIQRNLQIEKTFKNFIQPFFLQQKLLPAIALQEFKYFTGIAHSRVHNIFDFTKNDTRFCFVPLGDFINFHYKKSNIISYTDKKTNRLIFKSKNDINKGKQIFTIYGKNKIIFNHVLMMDYGFCFLDYSEIEFLNNTKVFVNFISLLKNHFRSENKQLNRKKRILIEIANLMNYPLQEELTNIINITINDNLLFKLFDPNIIALFRILAGNENEINFLLMNLNTNDNQHVNFDELTSNQINYFNYQLANLLSNKISDRNENLIKETIVNFLQLELNNRLENLKKNNNYNKNNELKEEVNSKKLMRLCIEKLREAESKILQKYIDLIKY